jgi:cholesterol transport system auxiliary component
VLYRLDYTASSHPQAYALSQWVAPPGELMTLRLRERIAAANAGFTLTRATRGAREFRLEATLDRFIQVFSSPTLSHCTVTLTVILARGPKVIGQRTFTAEEAAPTADAPGAVRGLVQATDSNIEQILRWIDLTLAKHAGGGDSE